MRDYHSMTTIYTVIVFKSYFEPCLLRIHYVHDLFGYLKAKEIGSGVIN